MSHLKIAYITVNILTGWEMHLWLTLWNVQRLGKGVCAHAITPQQKTSLSNQTFTTKTVFKCRERGEMSLYAVTCPVAYDRNEFINTNLFHVQTVRLIITQPQFNFHCWNSHICGGHTRPSHVTTSMLNMVSREPERYRPSCTLKWDWIKSRNWIIMLTGLIFFRMQSGYAFLWS
jgi:hypothetical protein